MLNIYNIIPREFCSGDDPEVFRYGLYYTLRTSFGVKGYHPNKIHRIFTFFSAPTIKRHQFYNILKEYENDVKYKLRYKTSNERTNFYNNDLISIDKLSVYHREFKCINDLCFFSCCNPYYIFKRYGYVEYTELYNCYMKYKLINMEYRSFTTSKIYSLQYLYSKSSLIADAYMKMCNVDIIENNMYGDVCLHTMFKYVNRWFANGNNINDNTIFSMTKDDLEYIREQYYNSVKDKLKKIKSTIKKIHFIYNDHNFHITEIYYSKLYYKFLVQLNSKAYFEMSNPFYYYRNFDNYKRELDIFSKNEYKLKIYYDFDRVDQIAKIK